MKGIGGFLICAAVILGGVIGGVVFGVQTIGNVNAHPDDYTADNTTKKPVSVFGFSGATIEYQDNGLITPMFLTTANFASGYLRFPKDNSDASGTQGIYGGYGGYVGMTGQFRVTLPNDLRYGEYKEIIGAVDTDISVPDPITGEPITQHVTNGGVLYTTCVNMSFRGLSFDKTKIVPNSGDNGSMIINHNISTPSSDTKEVIWELRYDRCGVYTFDIGVCPVATAGANPPATQTIRFEIVVRFAPPKVFADFPGQTRGSYGTFELYNTIRDGASFTLTYYDFAADINVLGLNLSDLGIKDIVVKNAQPSASNFLEISAPTIIDGKSSYTIKKIDGKDASNGTYDIAFQIAYKQITVSAAGVINGADIYNDYTVNAAAHMVFSDPPNDKFNFWPIIIGLCVFGLVGGMWYLSIKFHDSVKEAGIKKQREREMGITRGASKNTDTNDTQRF